MPQQLFWRSGSRWYQICFLKLKYCYSKIQVQFSNNSEESSKNKKTDSRNSFFSGRPPTCWPYWSVTALMPSETGVTGGVVTSGHCCQDKGLMPAPPRPCPVGSKLQPLALTVTLALTDTLNLRQPGKHTHTYTYSRERSLSPACYLPFLQN